MDVRRRVRVLLRRGNSHGWPSFSKIAGQSEINSLSKFREFRQSNQTQSSGVSYKMQTIALVCLAIVALKSAFLMSILWHMASTGQQPAWLAWMLGSAHQVTNRVQR
jgi:hypothetical protein